MQYLLTEEEFKAIIPRAAVEPFLKATADFHRRKTEHILKHLQTVNARDAIYMDRNPIAAAIDQAIKTWTEQPPKPEDFMPKTKDEQPAMRKQLAKHIATMTVTSQNIGEIRARLLMPFDCDWNGWVRDITAERENK